ncbi:MAG: FecR domain-containing protein [Candidatus Wallbacteria bacterium]|nr:FecR domain-containing protein [Candidatus Wallbacteria bacterium]
MSDCRDISEKLTDFVEGELSGADQARVAAHLGGCDGCKAEVRSLQALFQTIGELPDLSPPAEAAGRVMARIRARSGRTPAQPPASGWLGWLRTRPAQAAGLAVLILALGLMGLRLRSGHAVHEQVAGVPSGVKLEVSAGKANVEGAAAATGALLAEGGLLEVSDDFKGRLVYPDGTAIKVRPGTAVRVFSHSLGLKQGQVWLKVKKGGGGFQVETPQAVVAVRGTVFGVDSGPDQTQVQVEEGAVEVKTQSDSVMLSTGQGVKVTAAGILRQDGFLQVFELNRDDFVGKPHKNAPVHGGK